MKKMILVISFGMVVLFSFLFLFLLLSPKKEIELNSSSSSENYGVSKVSDQVEMYRPLFDSICGEKYGLKKEIPVIMALTMQESGGRVPDVMQSSESIGLPPNSITDPAVSIDIGCRYFKKVLAKANGDINLVLQSYNFGIGFIDWVQNGHGGKYTLDLAYQFSNMMKSKMGWGKYGDPEYVPHVRRYLGNNNVFAGDFKRIMDEALKYQGTPYSWGGNNPQTLFDCSGLTQWTYKQAGINLPRTAEEQYYSSTRVTKEEAKVGDLVFFSHTYAGKFITHVGIYLGDGQMYNSNGHGVGYSSVFTGYWGQHFAGFGRVADFK